MWVDVDVTEAPWLRSEHRSYFVAAVADVAVSLLGPNPAAESGHLEALEQSIPLETPSSRPQEDASDFANATKTPLRVTDAVELGVDGCASLAIDTAMQLNVGPVQRMVRVVDLPDGGEGIQVRSVARLLLAASPDAGAAISLGSFLNDVRAALVSPPPA
jgi:hypothetical protein